MLPFIYKIISNLEFQKAFVTILSQLKLSMSKLASKQIDPIIRAFFDLSLQLTQADNKKTEVKEAAFKKSRISPSKSMVQFYSARRFKVQNDHEFVQSLVKNTVSIRVCHFSDLLCSANSETIFSNTPKDFFVKIQMHASKSTIMKPTLFCFKSHQEIDHWSLNNRILQA